MTTNIQSQTSIGKHSCRTCIAIFLLAGPCFSQAKISPSPSDDLPTAQAAWREFHGANMVRFNQFENVLNVNNVRNLGLKWSYATGRGVFSSPAMANGVVYVGSNNDVVYAFGLK